KACQLPWAVYLHGTYRHPTQLYAALYEFAAIGRAVRLERTGRCRTPGMIFNIWLILHAAGRLLMEAFRDDYRGHLILEWSVGSWMSLALMGLALAQILAHRRAQ
ncbi:MAG: hypothetical protein HC888_11350, partial [Candidatus Competibacteraceae bacterium]|nr:hypothetical protein [Candidatus Competibacteraceae bacterium]